MRVLSPCFLFRPDVFARACWRKLQPRPERCLAKSAWGDWLEVEPRKFIGAHIYMRGAHELNVCEVLWRLAERGETAVDAGANIGVMTSLLSRKVGPQGRVLAFEPHPVLSGQLQRNIRRWEHRRIEVFQCALSSKTGVIRLVQGASFDVNEGTVRVGNGDEPGTFHPVQSIRLDEVLPAGRCGVTKIDVEGHELEVLLGAAHALSEQRLRDVVFESSWSFPRAAHQPLQRAGYRIFEVQQSLGGPKLAEVSARCGAEGRLADYLATVNAPRALDMLSPRGWQVLKSGRRPCLIAKSAKGCDVAAPC